MTTKNDRIAVKDNSEGKAQESASKAELGAAGARALSSTIEQQEPLIIANQRLLNSKL